MKRMAASNVLIVGMSGLGVEIGGDCSCSTPKCMLKPSSEAKNLVLAGVKSVTIFDPEPVKVSDLSSQVWSTSHRVFLHSYVAVFLEERGRWEAPRRSDRLSSVRTQCIRSSTKPRWPEWPGGYSRLGQGFSGMGWYSTPQNRIHISSVTPGCSAVRCAAQEAIGDQRLDTRKWRAFHLHRHSRSLWVCCEYTSSTLHILTSIHMCQARHSTTSARSSLV